MMRIRASVLGVALAMAATGATVSTATAQVRVGVGVHTPSVGVRVMFGTPVYYSYAPVLAYPYAPYPVTYEEVYLEPWPVWPAGYWDYVRVYDPYAFARYQRWVVFERDYRDAWRQHDWDRFREMRRERWQYRNDLYRADRDFGLWRNANERDRGRGIWNSNGRGGRDDRYERGQGRGHDRRRWRD
jgi:hypothetical protein